MYYVLVVKYPQEPWVNEFGDHDKEAVEFERQDIKDSHQTPRGTKYKILRLKNCRRGVVEKAVEELNNPSEQ